MSHSWLSWRGTLLVAVLGVGTLAHTEEILILDLGADEAEVAKNLGFGRVRRPQSGKRGYGPEQMEGKPDTPGPGDRPSAWASLSADGQAEWVTCSYEKPVMAKAIVVYENYAPGALTKITAFDKTGEEVIAWEGQDPTPRSKPRGTSVIPVRLAFPVQKIKLYIDSQAVPNWNEIDAVGLEDVDGNTHWVAKAEASSTYASPGQPAAPNGKFSYSPLQVTGEPDTLRPGDQASAWASASPDGQNEWFMAMFEKAEVPAEIVVFENTAPGAITKVTVFNDKNKEITVWEGLDPTPRDQPWGVSVFPIEVDFPFKRVKLYINSREIPGYNEIDAIGLRGLNGDTQWASDAKASTTYGTVSAEPEPAMEAKPADLPDPENKVLKELEKLRLEIESLKAQLKDLKK